MLALVGDHEGVVVEHGGAGRLDDVLQRGAPREGAGGLEAVQLDVVLGDVADLVGGVGLGHVLVHVQLRCVDPHGLLVGPEGLVGLVVGRGPCLVDDLPAVRGLGGAHGPADRHRHAIR